MMEYYQRNLHSYSIEEQIKLLESKVAIVGVGGGGCVVAEILARTGVGHIRLIDGDSFEVSNCNRQIGAVETSIGQNKALVMQKRLNSINPALTVDAIPLFLTKDNYQELLGGCDIVCDTADGYENKILVSDCCIAIGVPYVSGGLSDTRFWTAVFSGKDVSTRNVLQGQGNSLFANPADIFIQGGFQAQEIINFLLGRDWRVRNKIISFNHQTYMLNVKDIPAIV